LTIIGLVDTLGVIGDRVFLITSHILEDIQCKQEESKNVRIQVILAFSLALWLVSCTDNERVTYTDTERVSTLEAQLLEARDKLDDIKSQMDDVESAISDIGAGIDDCKLRARHCNVSDIEAAFEEVESAFQDLQDGVGDLDAIL